jgi:hypothetical protein
MSLDAAHGSRFSSAPPVVTSKGTDTWSCAMNQSPFTVRKHVVARTQKPVVVVPLFNVPLSRLRLRANATSPPHGDGEVANLVSERVLVCREDALPVSLFCSCPHVLEGRFDVERHDVWRVNGHHRFEIRGANRASQLVSSLSNIGFVIRVVGRSRHRIHASRAAAVEVSALTSLPGLGSMMYTPLGGGPAMRMLIRDAVSVVMVASASMAAVTIAMPAVSSAQCENGDWWDAKANICRPAGAPLPLACDPGQWWDPTANVCRPLGVGPQPLACDASQWWDPTANVCRPLGVGPQPLACDNGSWWDPTANACRPPLVPPAG